MTEEENTLEYFGTTAYLPSSGLNTVLTEITNMAKLFLGRPDSKLINLELNVQKQFESGIYQVFFGQANKMELEFPEIVSNSKLIEFAMTNRKTGEEYLSGFLEMLIPN